MQNLLEIQDALRSAPDQQLMSLMQNANASVPQWAVASELNNRKEMRDEQTRQEGLGQPTIVDQLTGTGQAPTQQTNAAGVPQGIASGMAQSMAPQTDVAQNTGIKTVAPNTAAPVATMASGGILKLASGSFPKYSEPYEEKYIFSYPEHVNSPPITLKPTAVEFPTLIKGVRKLGGTITEARSGQVMKGDSAEEFSSELDYGIETGANHSSWRNFTRSSKLPPSEISLAKIASKVTDGGSSGLERLEAENEEDLPKDMQRKLDVRALARGGAGAADIANSLGLKIIDVIDIGMGIVGHGAIGAPALVTDLAAWLNGTLAGDVISAEELAKNATAMRTFADGLFYKEGDWMPRASNMVEAALELPNEGDNAAAESAAYQEALDTNTANPELRAKINAMPKSMSVFAPGAPVDYTRAGLASLDAPIGRADDEFEHDIYIDARKATQKIKSDAETQLEMERYQEAKTREGLTKAYAPLYAMIARDEQLKAERQQRSEQAARYVDEKSPGLLQSHENISELWNQIKRPDAFGLAEKKPVDNPDFRDAVADNRNIYSASDAIWGKEVQHENGSYSFNDMEKGPVGKHYPDLKRLALEQHDFSESADNRFEKPGARNTRKGIAAVTQPNAAELISAQKALISDTPVSAAIPQPMSTPEYSDSPFGKWRRKNLREVEARKQRLRLAKQWEDPPPWLQVTEPEDGFLSPEELKIDTGVAGAGDVDADAGVAGAGDAGAGGADTGGAGAGGAGAGSKIGAADSYKSQLAGILDKMESSRDQDKWLSLAEMGMRLMASTNPNILSAVGESGLGALQGYKEQQSADEKQQLNILGKLADMDLAERTLASRESIARNKPTMTTGQVISIQRKAYDEALENYQTLIDNGAEKVLLKNAYDELGRAEDRVNKIYKLNGLPPVSSGIPQVSIIRAGT